MAICEQQLGVEHPTTVFYLSNLGALYTRQEKYAEAEPLYRRALAVRGRALGPDHPQTVQSLKDLAEISLALHTYTDAEPLYRRLLALQEQQGAASFPELAGSLSNLACLCISLRRYSEAEQQLTRALALYEQIFAQEHELVWKTRTLLTRLSQVMALAAGAMEPGENVPEEGRAGRNEPSQG